MMSLSADLLHLESMLPTVVAMRCATLAPLGSLPKVCR
jgi:hypothetical protein